MRFLFGLVLGTFVGYRISQNSLKDKTLQDNIAELKASVTTLRENLKTRIAEAKASSGEDLAKPDGE